MKISSIVAIGPKNEIGLNGKMPWSIPSEYNHFLNMVSGHFILMGRINWEDNSNNLALLKRVSSIVISKKKESSFFMPSLLDVDVHFFTDIEQALKFASEMHEEELFVIGGSQIYQELMPIVSRIYLSVVPYVGNADTYFPNLPSSFVLTDQKMFFCSESNKKWELKIYDRIQSEDEKPQK